MEKSSKPNKQRAFWYNLKLHQKVRGISSHLSKDLRKELKKRALPVRKGDKVKVMRGSYKGTIGKIARIDRANMKVFVENVKRRKVDGTEVLVPLIASNLVLTEVDKNDKFRFKYLEKPAEVAKVK